MSPTGAGNFKPGFAGEKIGSIAAFLAFLF